MKVFVTGASGWIGSAAVADLLAAGHDVIGLARSDGAAERVAATGATVFRGDLDDPGSLRRGAENADAVIHLGYHHDFTEMARAARIDGQAIAAFGDVLAGSDRPLVIASGVLGLSSDRAATEDDRPPAGVHPRMANAAATLELADRGVRSVVVRFAPTVHGKGDYGFMARVVEVARERGVAGYVGEGHHRWPAVHRLDAGHLLRLAVEQARAGSVVHAVAEEGVRIRDVAEVIGRKLGLPVESVAADQAVEHFGWLGAFLAMDSVASSALTREQLGWQPIQPGLLDDLEAGYYTDLAS